MNKSDCFRCIFSFGLDFICFCNVDIMVASHTGSGRNKLTDDDILLKSEQIVDLSADSRIGKNLGRFLEGCRREEGLGLERSLCDSEENG